MVVDVRKMPRSRTSPHFNQDAFPELLAPYHIGYAHIAALGGLRGKDQSVPSDVNGYWRNESFHNYADYAMSADFRAGLDRLRELSRNQSCAVMCAETLWWRCHRRIIADYLLADGEDVFHLLGPDNVERATLTRVARQVGNGVITYPGGYL